MHAGRVRVHARWGGNQMFGGRLMGLYDTLEINCPSCGHTNGAKDCRPEDEIQSKGAQEPYMNHFTIENAPAGVLSDVADWTTTYPLECERCHAQYRLRCSVTVTVEPAGPASRSEP